MLSDILSMLHSWQNRPAVALVTSDPFATDLAQRYKFEIIPDLQNSGETGAIEMATRICEQRGVDNTLVIPADIPLIQSWELEEILKQAPEEGSVLVPAADGRGTNAAHHAAAQATGKPCIVLHLPGIAVDVDNPADLQALIAHPGETRAQRLAREWNLTNRLLATGSQ